MDDIDDKIYCTHYRTLKQIKADHEVAPLDLDTTTGVWIWGKSGVGKSRQARLDYPGSYIKNNNKWWDHYQGQETVIMDDFGKDHACLGSQMKRWLDHYAFTAETKGGSRTIRPKLIIVTSQYHIDEIWKDDAETIEAITRRCKVIHMSIPVMFNKKKE